MSWFKVDDGFYDCRKVVDLFSREKPTTAHAALSLWLRSGTWSSKQLTGGAIPTAIARQFGTKAAADALVRCGLWEKARGKGGDPGGYQFHDWAEYQPDHEIERAAARERSRRWREKKKREANASQNGDVTRDGDASRDAKVPDGSPSRPVPSRPVPGGAPEPDRTASSGHTHELDMLRRQLEGELGSSLPNPLRARDSAAGLGQAVADHGWETVKAVCEWTWREYANGSEVPARFVAGMFAGAGFDARHDAWKNKKPSGWDAILGGRAS